MLNRTPATARATPDEREFAATVCGIEGRATFIAWGEDRPGLFMHQTFKASRALKNYGTHGFKRGSRIVLEMRFDDNCKNGRNSFAMTGEVWEPGARDIAAGGCIHELLAENFPEVSHLIRWHLSDTAGPMHYLSNAAYHAGNLDHHGKAAGEPYAWDSAVRFYDEAGRAFPIVRKIGDKFAAWLQARAADGFAGMVAQSFHHSDPKTFGPKYTLADGDGCFGSKWHECPFDSVDAVESFLEALTEWRPEFIRIPTLWSEGKARDLDAARSVAVWPDATDAELSVPRAELIAALEARLPALLADMRASLEAAGFTWSEPAA